ncbi:deoxyuridine 5'-triphosphate nucleotidohydrolase [Folsomia candida]|uniref:deoxyuridine 5'-triphosphate nucleotidohydrolase n=1 Tax=Folsomia candida TaxID=158441 RepID=UPI000B90195A|nr:deoxyuridine 5'-triphosphate nucleotidohydrolase [Folsomia candida]
MHRQIAPLSSPPTPPASPSTQPTLYFTRLTEKAWAPIQLIHKSAGYDLRSAYEYTVIAYGRCLVLTDLQIKIPPGCYGRIAPRSGLAWLYGIDVGAGVIDENYTGNIGIVLFNHCGVDFHVKYGDRVAQLICEKIEYPLLVELKVNINREKRHDNGFGSTGI